MSGSATPITYSLFPIGHSRLPISCTTARSAIPTSCILMPIRRWLISLSLLFIAAAPLRAQSGLSLWLGGGGATDESGPTLSKGHLYGAVQLGFPLLPVAVRGELVLAGGSFERDARSMMASVVFPLKLPVIQPYGIAGYGTYAKGDHPDEHGLSIGAGARAGISRLGVFAEIRYHNPIKNTLITLGITM
jgi:hypothetical protein